MALTKPPARREVCDRELGWAREGLGYTPRRTRMHTLDKNMLYDYDVHYYVGISCGLVGKGKLCIHSIWVVVVLLGHELHRV